MDLTKKWHRSEFVSHEMLEVHRGIECELDSIQQLQMAK